MIEGNLTRIELRCDSIESPGMNGLELRSIDTPLIRRDLQPVEDGRQGVVDVPALVAANHATSHPRGHTLSKPAHSNILDFLDFL